MAYALGMAWQISGDRVRAVPWYEQAASAGLTDAQILLGSIYAEGLDVPRDPVRAYAWLHQAAENGHRNATLLLNALSAGMTARQIRDAEALSASLAAGVESDEAGTR